jgi:hypothetical protein
VPEVFGRPSDPAVTERLRQLCLALPETSERLSHGEPAWFVAGRLFATTADHHHDERLALWCAAPEGAQEMLTKAAPDRFFRPPYVGHRGWLGVYLDIPDLDWDEVAAIIERAYRVVAPTPKRKRLSPASSERGPSERRAPGPPRRSGRS